MNNPFVFACITPHGGEIIPELQGDHPKRMEVTRKSLSKLGENMTNARPDCIIVLSPHGTRIDKQFCIANSERMVGSFSENNFVYEMERKVDRELAESIYEAAAETLPVAMINFGTGAGPLSCLPLDWGAIVPLRFMPDVPIVVITPTREISFDAHIALGKTIKDVAGKSDKRIGLIASCDWSHTHDESGPYGFNKAAKTLDEEVVQLIKTDNLEALSEFNEHYIEAAKPDGIWQSLILAGALAKEDRKSEFLSYEAPTYFGLLCAAYYQK